MTTISSFMKKHFKHFNAATTLDAAQGYVDHLNDNGQMFLALAGAMSTAELGLSLADMIRNEKIHAISCTGANLEEDVFNLVAHHHYLRIPNYRDLKPEDEQRLLEKNLNRVTDTCIPEEEAIRKIQNVIVKEWKKADKEEKQYFPHEFVYKILTEDFLKPYYQIDEKNSWVLAAAQKKLPIFVPGWEDSTLGNIYASLCIKGEINNVNTIRSGIEYMVFLSDWYIKTAEKYKTGFFQIGGGIAGDFPICVVPMLRQDLEKKEVPLWSYFCQISDSTTSYGSYSGAIPNEKITWEKLSIQSQKYVIESDATIVAPLIFSYVLEQIQQYEK